ncbi:MAG: septum formation protein Maf [Clostridia bacterium]|nr:septum formation protein Maf [Clostridia bacterium]
MKQLDIVLASASPRRSEILTSLGVRFRTVVSDADESAPAGLTAAEFVMHTAHQKCESVLNMLRENGTLRKNTLIIACDTVVVYSGMIIGKPKDEAHAILTLGMLSDSWHSVWSGLAVYYKGRISCRAARTDVKFRDISEEEIMAYVETREPMGKAGSYAIQMRGAAFVERIEGEYNNVVGLPVAELLSLLREEYGVTLLDVALYEA